MLFTNNNIQSQSQNSYIQNIINRQHQPVFTINNNRIRNLSIQSNPIHNPAYRPQQQQVQVQQQVQPDEIKPKKMKWGEPTWYLFHTLAEKVKDEHFAIIREGLLNTIYSICANLPCPDCAEHASAYLNGINFKTIQTKDQLKKLLFMFHNIVNAKKGFPLFPIHELDTKYSQMNLIHVIYTFMPYFQDKSKSIRMIANDFHRSRLAVQLKKWFNSNIRFFDL